MPCAVLPVFLINYRCARLKDDWHMHHHGSRYPHSWASDKNRVEEYWQEREPQQAQFRERLYEREGQVRQMRTNNYSDCTHASHHTYQRAASSKVFFKPGTALLYRADTWHRAGELNE